jgi:hypothetical protein
MMKFGELRKTSATLDGTFTPGIFNLDVIYEYLEITDEINTIKYNGMEKTKEGERRCNTFNNQVTVKVGNVNIKIFKSKTFSISGAGTMDTAIENSKKALEKILEKINLIKVTKNIKPEKKNGFYVYYDDKIITKNGGEYICSYPIRKTKVIIRGDPYTVFDTIPGTYIQEKHQDKKKIIINNLAEEIGFIEYFMKRRSKSLCIKGCKYVLTNENEYEIINSYNSVLGIMKITIFEGKSILPVVLEEDIELTLVATEEDTKIDTIKFSNCNYNMKFSSDVNRAKICSYLEKENVCYTYDPSSYPGVKFKIGGTKITIFRTGSVMFSSKEDIKKEAYPFIIKMFEEDFSNEIHKEVEEVDCSLTIWDI